MEPCKAVEQERSVVSLWQCEKRLWWVSKKVRRAGRRLSGQSWRKMARHEPGKDRGDREKTIGWRV